MNDWLEYKGSGSSRAYTGDYVGGTISHYSKRKAESMNRDAEGRLYEAYMDKFNKLRQDYRTLEIKLKSAQNLLEIAETGKNDMDSFRSGDAKIHGALHAHQEYAKKLFEYDKKIAEYKAQISELNSKISKNLEEQKKTQANMNSLEANAGDSTQWAIDWVKGLKGRRHGMEPTEISNPKNNSRRR